MSDAMTDIYAAFPKYRKVPDVHPFGLHTGLFVGGLFPVSQAQRWSPSECAAQTPYFRDFAKWTESHGWTASLYCMPLPYPLYSGYDHLTLESEVGRVSAEPGDWILMGEGAKQSLVKVVHHSDFKTKYERVG